MHEMFRPTRDLMRRGAKGQRRQAQAARQLAAIVEEQVRADSVGNAVDDLAALVPVLRDLARLHETAARHYTRAARRIPLRPKVPDDAG